MIFFACLVIPGGAAGNRFGRKGVLLAGLTLFAAGGLMSAMAPNVPLLLASRAVTGAGAAAVLPSTLAVVLHAVLAGRKNATIATWALMTVAQALAVAGPGRAREVITAFVSGADAGLRMIGISVLVLGGLVVLQSLLSRRSA